MKNQSRMSRASRSGFTLIEMLLVLAILGILAGIIVPRYGGQALAARITATIAQIATFKGALASFEIDNGYFPRGREGLQELVTQKSEATGWKGPYVEEIPLDQWGHAFIYECPGRVHPAGFDLVSMGPDGQLGTDDDITNGPATKKH